MSEDVAGRLAEALRESTYFAGSADRIARYLLPVVDDLIERAAREAEARGYERGRQELAQYLSRVYDESRAAALRGGDGR